MRKFEVLLALCLVLALGGCRPADTGTTGVEESPLEEVVAAEKAARKAPAESAADESGVPAEPEPPAAEESIREEEASPGEEPAPEAPAESGSPFLAFREVRDYNASGPNPSPEDPLLLDESHVRDAQMTTDDYGELVITVEFTEEGAQLFWEATQRLAGSGYIAIWVGGELVSVPMVRDPVPDGIAMITGNLGSMEVEAKELVEALQQAARAARNE